ncbi:hypothetical protein [Vibrio sp. ES.051]
MTLKQFCLDNDINYQTFHYWFKNSINQKSKLKFSQ